MTTTEEDEDDVLRRAAAIMSARRWRVSGGRRSTRARGPEAVDNGEASQAGLRATFATREQYVEHMTHLSHQAVAKRRGDDTAP